MTIEQQKFFEKMYASEAGGLLGESWEVEFSPDEVDYPDLIVTTKSGTFGLEVREIYFDESSKGSVKKAHEKENSRKIKKLASAYYNKNRSSIKVDFLGNIGHHDQLLDAITGEAKQLTEWERKRIAPYNGCVVYIQKLPDQFGEYTRWIYVSDRVGYVRAMTRDFIQEAIAKKAKNLKKYRKNISDVRLLLVSDGQYNSGRAFFADDISFDACGFNSVYYLLSPTEVHRLTE